MVCEPQYPDIETFFRLHSTKRIILYILLRGATNFQFGLSALGASYAEENRSPAVKAQGCSSNERQWMRNLMRYGFACRSNSFQKNAFFVVNAADSIRAIAVPFRDGNFAACFRHSIHLRSVPRIYVFQSLLNVMCSKLRKSVDSPQLDGFTLHMRFHRA